MKITLKQKKIYINIYILHLYITSNFEKMKGKRGGKKQYTHTKTISLKNS